MTDSISNSDDIIDSRSVMARIEELAEEDNDEDETNELKALLKLQEQCEGYSDWQDGETLIRDSYFQQYAEQLADDLGLTDNKITAWPYRHIDWKAAADELKQDYTTVDFDGVDYWIRCS